MPFSVVLQLCEPDFIDFCLDLPLILLLLFILSFLNGFGIIATFALFWLLVNDKFNTEFGLVCLLFYSLWLYVDLVLWLSYPVFVVIVLYIYGYYFIVTNLFLFIYCYVCFCFYFEFLYLYLGLPQVLLLLWVVSLLV